MLCAIADLADPKPMLLIASLNFCLSSALSIASFEAPINSTSNFFSTPCLSKSSAQFNAVWPPIVGSKASGRSFSIILASICHWIGSM